MRSFEESKGAKALAWAPHPGQKRFLEANARIKVLACGRRWGKTDACAAQIALRLLTDASSRQLIVAPTLDQARLLFDRVVEMLDDAEVQGFTIRKSPYPHLRLGEHRLMARSGHLGRSLRGNEATDIVIDEAAFLPEEVITEIALPMLATTHGTLTLISTPKGHNHFWRFYMLGERGDHGVWSATAPTKESPFIAPGFLEIQRDLISDRAYRVEYEAEFLDSAGQVFRTEAIDACLVAELPPEPEGRVYIGVDWARYEDFTAVAVLAGYRDSCRLLHIERMTGLTWNEQVRRVAEIVGRHRYASVLCDATGVGDVALEMLQVALPRQGVQGLVFTAAEKAALIDVLAWLIENAALKMRPEPELIRELQHFEAKPSASGHTKFGAPSGYHDDLVVALALAARQLPRSYRPTIALTGERRFE
ncbi:MAG: terminase family protein [Fimbriimonadaceae bacterium]|nr:terminase family protein [Fimbriimonadaceae bacterium]